MKRIINCIECPKGCEITVETEDGKITAISGNSCPRGKAYAETEIVCPRRIITTTVRTENGKVLPVKTDKGVKKADMFAVMEKIKGVTVKGRVETGEIIAAGITEDVNLVATANVADL